MSATTPAGPETINWHKDEIADTIGHIAEARDVFHDELVRDVGPVDISIDGIAVADCLRGQGAYWAVGFTPDAGITLEHWSTDDNVLVRLAKKRNDGETRAVAGMLARQVRGTGDWVPGLSARRTAKIVGLVAATSTVTVDIFNAPNHIDDDTFPSMRSAAASTEKNSALRERLRLTDELLIPPKKRDFRAEGTWAARAKYGWDSIAAATRDQQFSDPFDPILWDAVIESFEVQADAQPTDAEVTHEVQHLVDSKLGELRAIAHTLSTVIPVVRAGRRVWPTRPQHGVTPNPAD